MAGSPRTVWVLLLAFLPTVFAQGLDNYVRIDCGGNQTFFNSVNQTWDSDRFFSAGDSGRVMNLENFPREQERTLRYFPISEGKKNCYEVPVLLGRHQIQMFFAYNNYDNLSHSPSFDVSVEGTVVFSWRYPWADDNNNFGAYSDLYAYIHDSLATICFYSFGTDTPVIGALELLKVDDLSYNSNVTGQNVIIIDYGRLTGGNSSFGPGFDNVTDLGGRSWETDDGYTNNVKAILSTQANITGANLAPNYWPTRLYQTCRFEGQPGIPIVYDFTVDAKLDYQIWFHFAEIDPTVINAGLRVFNVSINGLTVLPSLDLFQQVGANAAFDYVYTVQNLTGGSLTIALAPVIGSPLICGLEVLAVVPADIATNLTEAAAMRALRDTLNVPSRLGWNGDPCAPTDWDAWEGVTCNLAADGVSLIVTHINIAEQGITGYIAPEIIQLSHLITMNASNNQISGPIPSGLGTNNLISLDLSYNALVGAIPISLGSAQMQHLSLDNNHLAGSVPEAIYTIGVHGGYINLADNLGLCGVPSLPNCSHKAGRSTGAIIGIVVGVLAAVVAIAGGVFLYMRRRSQEDYNFNLPHQLVERTKWYQQHKMTKGMDPEGVSMMQTSIPNRFGFSSNIASHQ